MSALSSSGANNKRRQFSYFAGGSLLLLCIAGILWLANKRNENLDIEIPAPPPLPEPNALDFYVRATSLLAPTQVDERSLRDLQQAVALNAPALRTVRQGFAYPCLAPRVESMMAFNRKPSSGFRQLERQFVYESRVLAARGDWNGAMQSRLDGLHFAADISRGGLIMDYLVDNAMQALARRDISTIVPHLSAMQASVAFQRLRKINASRVSLAAILTEEKWLGVRSFQLLMVGNGWRSSMVDVFAKGSQPSVLETQMLTRKQVLQTYLQFANIHIANARLPYQSTPQPTPATVGLPAKFAAYFTSSFGRINFRRAHNDTPNALLETALALRVHQAEKKSLPATLDELAPGILPRVPIDPFGNGKQTLRYIRKTNSEYSLYSIGPDGQDDKGFVPRDNKGRTRPSFSQNYRGDVVFGVNS